MASQIFPERFSEGNFGVWLKHFERCATANFWDAETRASMLPAFLQGPAATYFESLTEDQKATYDALVASLNDCFCPDVNRERYYREFEDATLRPSEDPTLFLWRLKESLRNAEPTLSNSAFDALLRRQFMKAMPSSLTVKLLEVDPTPSLELMVSFAQRHRALNALPSGNSIGLSTCAVQSCPSPQQSAKPSSAEFNALLTLHQQQQDRFTKMEAMVSSLSENHAQLIAAVTPQHHTKSRAQAGNRLPASIECFRCHQLGHIARNCTFPPIRRRPQPSPDAHIQCSICFGWGHIGRDCANNKDFNSPARKSLNSLNYQGVPRY